MKKHHWIALAILVAVGLAAGGGYWFYSTHRVEQSQIAAAQKAADQQTAGLRAQLKQAQEELAAAKKPVQSASLPKQAAAVPPTPPAQSETEKLKAEIAATKTAVQQAQLERLRSELAAAKAAIQQPAAPSAQVASSVTAQSPAPQPGPNGKFGSDAGLFTVQGTPAGFTYNGVSSPVKARSCTARGGRLYRTHKCRKLPNGQRECKLGCTADGPRH